MIIKVCFQVRPDDCRAFLRKLRQTRIQPCIQILSFKKPNLKIIIYFVNHNLIISYEWHLKSETASVRASPR